ncbi:marvel domain-containing protein [Schizothecium vesticola]|uniref:Marvel domain-containing protein n=1 Tax=Schizothecium vesticola TaxID=314040 RepID=A0AA40K087_9PEZI|nr:marvel domain-containing protein [Schizothecium vesticola]
MELIPTILRGLQLLFVVILTGLIGNVIATNIDAAGSATAAINFTMFVIVLSWLTTIFGLATAFVDRIAIPMALLAADGAASLFTFIAAIVLSAKLGVANCGAIVPEDHSDSWIVFGSANDPKRCRQIQAGTVFMWFLFLTSAAALTLTFLGFRRGGGSVRSGPTMSQVRV